MSLHASCSQIGQERVSIKGGLGGGCGMGSEVNEDLLRVIIRFILADKSLACVSLQDTLKDGVHEALFVLEDCAFSGVGGCIVGVKDVLTVMRASSGDS